MLPYSHGGHDDEPPVASPYALRCSAPQTGVASAIVPHRLKVARDHAVRSATRTRLALSNKSRQLRVLDATLRELKYAPPSNGIVAGVFMKQRSPDNLLKQARVSMVASPRNQRYSRAIATKKPRLNRAGLFAVRRQRSRRSQIAA